MPDFTDPTHTLGYEFERHVIALFGKDFKVVTWAQDGLRSRQEIDFNPDLIVEHLPSKTVFGVECKFRSKLFAGNIAWAKEYQPQKYQRYVARTGHRVFIVIGIGGTPSSPDYMYCIPLWQAKFNFLNPDVLKRYRRNPRRMFEYDKASGQLK
ncbi:hypothetical protein [Methanocella sp. MCL-LM]|uniref:hypothetical protein n=1 Tax=Methanocella sp. MCL-LM TaxID=3412035 RepID=UPI003C75B769